MKPRCFGEVRIEVDKMAGLRLSDYPRIGIRHWDQYEGCNQLLATLHRGDELAWQGSLISVSAAEKMLGRNVSSAGVPRTFTRRKARLGHPRQVGALRCRSVDGQNFSLELHELCYHTPLITHIVTISSHVRINLAIGRERCLLFDPKRDQNKLERLK